MNCPLCSFLAHYLTSGEDREYWLCSKCRAIFVPTSFHISHEEEVRRYLEHENSLESEGYVQMFQNKIDILQDGDVDVVGKIDVLKSDFPFRSSRCFRARLVRDFRCDGEEFEHASRACSGFLQDVVDRSQLEEWLIDVAEIYDKNE